MKFISLNIENNKHFERIIPFFRRENPDVVCLQEVLEKDFEFIKKELGFDGIHQPWSYWNNQKHYPELTREKQGVAIFAKNITSFGSNFYIGKEENVLKSFEEYITEKDFQKNRALVWVEIESEDKKTYKFITTQLPVTKEGEVTDFQMEAIDALLSEIESFGEFVLCGDMNAPRGKKSFAKISEKYKDNIPKTYKTSIDQNLHRVKGIQFMVDGLFTTPSYEAKDVRLIDGVSDHMAVVAEIKKN